MPSVAPATRTQVIEPPSHVGSLKLRAESEQSPAFLKELQEKGYALVKNVISKEKSEEYVSRAFDWLEGFGLGFDRHDRSTW